MAYGCVSLGALIESETGLCLEDDFPTVGDARFILGCGRVPTLFEAAYGEPSGETSLIRVVLGVGGEKRRDTVFPDEFEIVVS
jgi:hypothetical protein